MDLNEITYREFEPDLRLRDYIKSYWYFSIKTNSKKTFDILPDGYFDLLIVFKNNRVVDSRLTGIWSKTVSISYSENTEVLGIRFKPLSIGGLFQFNIKDSLNDYLNVSIIDFDLNSQILIDNLIGFHEFLVNYLDQNFLKLIQHNKSDKRLKKCFDIIDNSIGNTSVDKISKTIGLSSRQLHRLVCNMIGIGVKDYSKIVRFKKSMKDVQHNKSDYFHYYDQSHFIREVKQFTGFTPEKLNLKDNDRFIQYYNFKQL
jgi:AraC-like DNA-binding protein